MNYGAAALIGALFDKGYTLEEAKNIMSRASAPIGPDSTAEEIADRAAARALLQQSVKSDPLEFKYTQHERPRILEEGLPIPPDYAFWLAIVYMMKNQPAMLERLVKSFWDNQAKMISHLAQAGAGNLVTAYSHSFIIALMLEQNYMIRQQGADDLIASLNVLVGAQTLTNLLQGFAVPEMITFATTGTAFKPK